MNKRWLLVSHERSGTEWMIASIIKNLFPILYQPNSARQACWDMDDDRFYDPKVTRKFLFDSDDQRSRLLYDVAKITSVQGTDHRVAVKSHHAYDFFEPLWDQIKEEFNVIYVMRDGRDVMTSMWNHGWDHDGFMPPAFNVARFIELPPSEAMRRYQGDYRVENMADRWSNHMLSWCDIEGVLYVTYEQLSTDYEATIKRVADYAGVEIPGEIETPGLTGIRPWIGKPYNFVHYISPYEMGFFYTNAEPGMRIIEKHNHQVVP